MQTILITGGAGFIGTNLIKYYLQNRPETYVIAVDNLVTGSEDNIKQFSEYKNFRFINHDIREPLQINDKIDIIYNLACPASPPQYQKRALFTLETSFIGFKNILELAKQNNSIVLHASTSEIYGNPSVHPQVETYNGNVNLIGPRACYDEGKRVAETLAYEYWDKSRVDVRLVRIFNTYGPFMNPADGRVIVNFILQALKNTDITVYGTGDQTRSFQYVDDLVNAFVKYTDIPQNQLQQSLEQNNWTTIPVINLGNPEEYTILETAQKILSKIPHSTSKITFKDLPKDDPIKRKPDISQARSVLGWQPEISFDEGLEKTIDYYINLLD